MALITSYTNPIELLRLMLTYQSWGDNASGTPSANAQIRTGVNVPGSFDSATLDAVRNIKIAFQVDEVSSAYTADLIQKLCQQFNLIQYTDTNGYECVKYLFSTESDSPVKTFTINNRSECGDLEGRDPSEICVNPVINYNYDYATGNYNSQLKIDNVQMSAYNEGYTSGFSGTDGQYYWNLCKTMLWPLVKHIEEMDDSLSDNQFIVDYDGALFRLQNIIKLMTAKTISFTVPFVEGKDTFAGEIVGIDFSHLSFDGNIVYTAVVTSNTVSRNTNSCTIEVMFLQDINQELLTSWQNSTEADYLYQDSYNDQNFFINASFDAPGIMSPLTYSNPNGTPVHITQINDPLNLLLSEMDNCQIGIDTDNDDFTFKNDTGVLYVGAKQKHWSGSDWIYDDANFANVNLQSLTVNRALYLDSNKRIKSSLVTVDTNGTWTFDTINNEIPLKVASGQGFHLNIGGLSVSNGAHDNPSIQVTPITGGLEIDSYNGSVVYINSFSPGDVNLCYAGGNVSINKAVAHERLHVGGNIRADGSIIPGYFTAAALTGDARIGRASDEGAGGITVQLGGADGNTSFRIVDRAWTKSIFSVSGAAPNGSLFVGTTGAVSMVSLTANRALVADGSKNVVSSNVTGTELSYLSGKNSVIDGSGAANYFPIFSGSNRLVNSIVTGSAYGIEINSADANYNGGLRIAADSTHHGVIALGCAAGGSGTQTGQWSILRRPLATYNYSLDFCYNLETNVMMRFTTNGNVGIGIDPLYKLHVNGSIFSTANIYGTDFNASGKFVVGTFNQYQTNTGPAWIGCVNDEIAGSLTVQLGGANDSTEFRIASRDMNKSIFVVNATAPSASLVINRSSVNIGSFGNELWNTNYKVLQIGTGLSVFSPVTTGYGYIRNNSYHNAYLQDIARYTGGSIQQNFNYDSITWHIAPSVTAGSVLTYVERMSLSALCLKLDNVAAGGSTATPFHVSTGNTYSNGTTSDKCKYFLYKTETDAYGFGVGGSSDIQYHSGGVGVTVGSHDFYIGNALKLRIADTVFQYKGNAGADIMRLTSTGDLWIKTSGAEGIILSGDNGYISRISASYSSDSELSLQSSGASIAIKSSSYSYDEFKVQIDRSVQIYENLQVDGDVYSNAFYYGSPTTDGSWRTTRSGNNLVHQLRVSGTWVTKATISA